MLRSLTAVLAAALVVSACTWQVTTVTPSPAPASAAVDAPPRSLGRAAAPVTMEEWSDFQ